MRGLLVALGLALYPATQLRFGGLPLGPGEILLIAWLGLLGLRLLARSPIAWNPALSVIATFWLVMILAQSLGMIVGLAVEPFHDFRSIAHDTLALTLMMCVSLGLAVELADTAHRRLITWLVVLFGTLVLALQIAGGYGLPGPPGVEPWFFNRLRGWAIDANMFGLASATFTLLSLHLMESAGRFRELVVGAACAAIGLTAGLLTRSDSYLVCVLLGLSVCLLVKARVWLDTLRHGRPSLRGAAIVVVLLAIPLATLASLPFMPATAALVEKQMTRVYEDHNQGDTRLALWGEAIEKGLESGLLGFGPGAHLTAKSFKRPPPDKFEAHSMVFELLTQGGVFAVAAYVWLCATTLLRTWRARLPALAGVAAGFVGFGMFHLIIRHPLLWFVFTICLLEAWRAVSVPALRRVPTAWPASGSLATGQIK